LSTQGTVNNAVATTLYSDTAGTQLIGTFTAAGLGGDAFTNGLFVSPSNVGVIGRAVVSFPNTGGATAFAIDNLTFSLYNNLFGNLLGF
jgi:hypothetical protein